MNVRDQYKLLDPSCYKELNKEFSKNFSCLLLNLRGEQNIGMCIRTSALMGCDNVYVCGRRHFDARFSVGTEKHINVERVLFCTGFSNSELDSDGIARYIKQKQSTHTLVFIEQTPFSKPLKSVDLSKLKNPLFIFGNESDGMPKNLIDAFSNELFIEIEQFGIGRSLNVSIAHAIVTHAFATQYQ